MMQPPRAILALPLVLQLNWIAAFSAEAVAQTIRTEDPGGNAGSLVVLPPRVNWSWHNPYDAITSRIYAQADLLRAHGDAAVDFGVARRLHAEAVDRELDNWVKQVRSYWDRKLIRERKMAELERLRAFKKDQYLNDTKARNSKIWNQLRNHPELTGTAIETGTALNFLLHRLSGTVLAFEFAKSSELSDEVRQNLAIDRTILSGLTLRQSGRDGGLHFKADGSTESIMLDGWPYLLRWDELQGPRGEFEEALAAASAESDGGQISVASLKDLEEKLMNLSREFYRHYDLQEWVEKGPKRFYQFRTAEDFLRRLNREVIRLQDTGDGSLFSNRGFYDPERDGNDLLALLTYMSHNGIEFAPAVPGDESAYHTMFNLLRNLYLTVAEQDPSIRPSR